MAETQDQQIELFVDQSIQKAGRIEQALGHLAKAIELELVDVALDSTVVSNGSREKFIELGQRLAEMSGITYELVVDISTATGIPMKLSQDNEIDSPAEPLTKPVPLSPQPGSIARIERPSEPTVRPEPGEPAGAEFQSRGLTAATERHEEDDKGDLYARILDVDCFPVMALREGGTPIELRIIGNSTVEIGQREIILDPHERYLFNALMLLRDKPRAAADLRQFGFHPGAKDSVAKVVFPKSMSSLSGSLNRAAGIQLIKHLGQRGSSKYAVNPDLVLVDLRTDEERATVVNDVKKK